MSKITLAPDVSGTGTFTIAAPNSNNNRTLTLPDASGTIATNETAGFESGTVMMFVQTAAPTGWTKNTTHDNKALRVVSGTASTGGTVAFTTAFASQSVTGTIANATATNQAATATNQATTQGGTVNSHTLSTAEIPAHSHTHLVYHDYGYATSAPNRTTGMVNGGGGAANLSGNNTGSGGAHSHGFSGASHNHTQNSHNHTQDAHNHTFTGTAINLAVSYVDVIICTKD